MFRGNNSSAGTPPSAVQLGSTVTLPTTSGTWHRLKVIFVGSSHKIYVDDVLYLSVTDATYLAAGNVGVRISNTTGATYTAVFDNFGVTSNLTGTWQSPAISIAAATTYGSSLVEWDTLQTPDSTFITAQTSIDAGATWQTITNGG